MLALPGPTAVIVHGRSEGADAAAGAQQTAGKPGQGDPTLAGGVGRPGEPHRAVGRRARRC